ncbi:hypothetical protein LU631_09815 [Erwinia tracheiphila]|uniref:Uncharacterized protein n=1 Tax=Erwinia tracheiphila TaxID=65700 RepID=A0A0M2KL68_9GAMM|nr:hypothetical protein [Erwinia tracheiphila]AXF75188.1 hypothetical protein AV903_02200 [Erwinia tracheiphila]EOS94049.1 hypothetical protein ETR_15806 [Erwinia tracheiphila PSU-1]KKF38062.1 hypothetical protein SY86_00575 [Erwinia tracheiphila]UIA82266.1 hypothetical protein LU604_16980 [Erwinia tracheiphila]UIA89454.1 hypothetical protein LU631_09815 [Erwinia tracheiphila]
MINFNDDSDKVSELAACVTEWHKNKVAQLQLVVDKKDADIELGYQYPDIKAGSELGRGLRLGITLALFMLGELPFTVNNG